MEEGFLAKLVLRTGNNSSSFHPGDTVVVLEGGVGDSEGPVREHRVTITLKSRRVKIWGLLFVFKQKCEKHSKLKSCI